MYLLYSAQIESEHGKWEQRSGRKRKRMGDRGRDGEKDTCGETKALLEIDNCFSLL